VFLLCVAFVKSNPKLITLKPSPRHLPRRSPTVRVKAETRHSDDTKGVAEISPGLPDSERVTRVNSQIIHHFRAPRGEQREYLRSICHLLTLIANTSLLPTILMLEHQCMSANANANFQLFEQELNRLVESFSNRVQELKQSSSVEAQLRDDLPFSKILEKCRCDRRPRTV
jgi:hypothetical protein